MESISLSDLRNQNIVNYLQCFDEKKFSNDENSRIVCKVIGCNKSYSDKTGAIRHLKSKHHQYVDVINCNKDTESNKKETQLDIRVKVNPDKIWNACVDLVCENSFPICFVEYPAFKEIIGPYSEAFKSHPDIMAINRENLRFRIVQTFSEMREDIKAEVKGKMVGVMADIASRYNKSVLGISISYFHDDVICVRTIAMKVLKLAHTARYIFQMILETLTDYGIEINQVISGTTDNGRNMVKAIADLDSYYQTIQCNNDSADCDENFIDHSLFDEQYYEDLLEEVRSMFPDSTHTNIIYGISCAAHCFHLIITHAIDDTPEVKSLIAKARELAKKLRTPNIRTILRESGLNMAKLDVITRWNSIYDMVGIFPNRQVPT